MNLEQLKNKNCFEVPENYFEELPKAVNQKIAHQKKVLAIKRSIITLTSIAASFTLVISIFNFSTEKNNQLTSHLTDSITTPVNNEKILTAEANISTIENTDEESRQNTVNRTSKKTKTERNNIEPTPALNDIDYQILDTYRDEIELNDYLLAIY